MGEGIGGRVAVADAAGEDVLSAMWRARSQRARLKCLRCRSCTLALMVGEEGPQYRWSCVDCGWQSSWFFVAGRGGRVRIAGGTAVTFAAHNAAKDS